MLRELKKAHCFQSEKRRALTKPEQELFLNFLKTHPVYEHWYPVFAVMIGTGLRVGEVTGLRWCDIDMESGMIDVNHTLVYYDHLERFHEPATEKGKEEPVAYGSLAKEQFNAEIERHGRY